MPTRACFEFNLRVAGSACLVMLAAASSGCCRIQATAARTNTHELGTTATLKPAEQLAGQYSRGCLGYFGETLKLLPDGTYKTSTYSDAIDRTTGASGTTTYGKYGFRDGFLVLCADYSMLNTSDPKYANQRTEELGHERQLLPVRWSKRLYLLGGDREVREFCTNVNSGAEARVPPNRGDCQDYFMRDGDQDKSVTGLPQLPSKWKNRLSLQPKKP